MDPISVSAGVMQGLGAGLSRTERVGQSADQAPETTRVFDPNLVSRVAQAAEASAPEIPLAEVTQPSRETIVRAAQQIQGFLQDSGRDLNVFVDDRAGYYVTTVMNPASGEVIRQIPPNETLRVARSVAELPGLRGLFVNTRA